MFGFTFLRTARVAEMHKRIRDLRQETNEQRDEAVSYRQVTIQQEQHIQALEKKCDIVGVSALKNQVVSLEDQNQKKDNWIAFYRRALDSVRTAARDTNGLVRVLYVLGEAEDGEKVYNNELRETHRRQDGILQRPLAPSAIGDPTPDHESARDEDKPPTGISGR